jgi:hypothetical protein
VLFAGGTALAGWGFGPFGGLTKWSSEMKLITAIAAAAALVASTGIGLADDHHFQAIQSAGFTLTFDAEGNAIIQNPNGHIMPDSPGQASPFTGNHQCTPATDTPAAQDNANVKPKGPEAGDCEEDE